MATDLSICAPAIEGDCEHWEGTKVHLSAARTAVGALRLNIFNAGIFQSVLGPNNSVCDRMEDELETAIKEADNIVAALTKSLAAYRNNEAETSDLIAGTFS